MKHLPKIIYLIFIFLFTKVHAQNVFDSSLADAVSVYVNTVGVNTHLYSGSEYIDYDHRIKGNPFYNALSFEDGSVVYNDINYNHVQILYDILHDDVVIKNYNDTPIILVKEKVSSFHCVGHTFINLMADSAFAGLKTSGFYDLLSDGTAKLLAKRKKEIYEKSNTVYTESSYDEKNDYYIFLNKKLYAVSSEKAVLDVLKDHKKEIVKYMHQSKIKFRKNREAAMISMVEYYNTLTAAK